jgi:ribonuclease R
VTIPAEGFVHISALTDDYYRYDRAGHVIAGFRSGNSYRLGDAVRVAVAAVDVDTRELDFRLLARTGTPSKARVKRPAKSRGKSSAKPPHGKKKKIRPGKNERRQKRGRR